jgi:RimJ/RimL family protein N-acetyltransferase
MRCSCAARRGDGAGGGVATSTLRKLCRLAVDQYGLRTLKAKASNKNVASQRVLEKAGFVPVEPADVAGRPGTFVRVRFGPTSGALSHGERLR